MYIWYEISIFKYSYEMSFESDMRLFGEYLSQYADISITKQCKEALIHTLKRKYFFQIKKTERYKFRLSYHFCVHCFVSSYNRVVKCKMKSNLQEKCLWKSWCFCIYSSSNSNKR